MGLVMNRRTDSPQKSLIAGLVMVGLVLGLQSAVAQEAVPCPAGGQRFSQSADFGAVMFQASGNSFTMTNTTTDEKATVSWCAEGIGNPSNGGSISGVMSTNIPVGQSRSFSFDQEIGEFVIYSVVTYGGIQPPPGNGNGGRDDGGDRSDGGDAGNAAAPPKGGSPGGSGVAAPPPPAIVGQPSVTG